MYASLTASKLVGTFLCLWLISCGGGKERSASKPFADESGYRKPNATELFDLRSKCAELGEKIMNGNRLGVALAQEQVSHYDPKSNRCYVELTVHTANLNNYNDYFSRWLHDAQTGEVLAFAESRKGVKTGFVFGSIGGGVGFDAANTKIDALMADDRKQ